MIRLSKQADYAILLMSLVARKGHGAVCSARGVAAEAHVNLPIASKVLKILAKRRLLVSQRGVSGGYSLSRAPSEISVAGIIEAVDGPIAVTECADADPCSCEQVPVCVTRPHWLRINDAIRDALEKMTLADMASAFFDPRTAFHAREHPAGDPLACYGGASSAVPARSQMV